MPWPKGVKRGANGSGRKTGGVNARMRPASTRIQIVIDLYTLAHARGVTNIQLAAAIHKDRVTVSRWKHGWGTPNAADIERMAAALGRRLILEEVE